MRQIKFRGTADGNFAYRGKLIDAGTTVYGYLLVDHDKGEFYILLDKYGTVIRVKPETIVQLIAIDAKGQEVFEGDKVIRVAGEDFNPEKAFPFYADFRDYGAIIDGEIVLAV